MRTSKRALSEQLQKSGQAAPAPQTDELVLAELAQALGHPARVAILRILMQRKVCLCGEIVALLPLAQSTVSQHLKVLREAGWVLGKSDGPRVFYCMAPEIQERFADLVSALITLAGPHL